VGGLRAEAIALRGQKSTRPGANSIVELSPFEFLDRAILQGRIDELPVIDIHSL
jgi:hypothetical protein